MAKKEALPWYSFIYKSPEIAQRVDPELQKRRSEITPDIYEQSVNKLLLMDYDQTFMLEPDPQVIPAGAETSEGEGLVLEDIKKKMFQVSDGSLSFVASCKCGYLTGNYNKGTVCPKCHTKCVGAIAEDINFGSWLEIPKELPPVLHPAAYRILRRWMGKMQGRSEFLLHAFLNPEIELPAPYAGVCGQGMQYFSNWDNFMSVISMVASQRKGKKSISDKTVFEFIERYKYQMFLRHIPVLSQPLHVLTQSGTMTYDDDASEFILQTWLELNETVHRVRHRADIKPDWLATRVWIIYSCWMKYCDMIIKPKLTGKTGFVRKNLLGGRLHSSGRGVIVPITKLHNADDIELPWKMIVGFYKLEIMNILEHRFGRDVNVALEMFNDAVVHYVPDIDACIHILKDECPFVGLPVLMGRNPCSRRIWRPLNLRTSNRAMPSVTRHGMLSNSGKLLLTPTQIVG